MVEKLRDEIGGKDFEELSALLGREGRRLTGALFEEVLKSRGGERARPGQACMRGLWTDAKVAETVAYQDGGKPAWRGHDRTALFLL
jgi:hypothetical protein